MIVSVPPLMPGLMNSINTNIHVGVGARLFDLAYLLGVSTPFPWIPTMTDSWHSNLEILPDCPIFDSSPWHRSSTSRSRGSFRPTKRCLIMQYWSRKHSQTTGLFLAAMKRRSTIIGLLRRPSHRQSYRRLGRGALLCIS